MKLTGKRSAGNPHAAFDEAGTGNGLYGTAPVLDPTYVQQGLVCSAGGKPAGVRAGAP